MQPSMVTAPNSGAVPAALKKRASDAASGAVDMEPEDWRGLVSGLLKFLDEESEEPEHAEDDRPQAAGIVFQDPNGTVLLLKRSPDEENYASHWAFPGGKAEAGETATDAARREATEEIGDHPGGDLDLLSSVETPNGFRFHTFRQAVPERFVPRLNGEHVDHVWARLDDLPEPLHPGVAETLKGMADDAALTDKEKAEGKLSERDDERIGRVGSGHREEMPESAFLEPASRKYPVKEKRAGGWRYDRRLLLAAARRARMEGDPSLAERADAVRKREFGEGVEANDAALRLALDRESVREKDQDGRLRIKVANISKACVNPYLGREIPGHDELGLDPDKVYNLFRDPEELAKAVESANGVQLLQQHIPVDAGDHKPYDVVGALGTEATYEHPYLKNSLSIWAQKAIDDVESEEKRELSMGYHYEPDMTPGVHDGQPYDGVMRKIRVNHVALVRDGRAGDDVCVGDSFEDLQWAAIERALLEMARG